MYYEHQMKLLDIVSTDLIVRLESEVNIKSSLEKSKCKADKDLRLIMIILEAEMQARNEADV